MRGISDGKSRKVRQEAEEGTGAGKGMAALPGAFSRRLRKGRAVWQPA